MSSYVKDIKCPKCGMEYKLYRDKLPCKDDDELLCQCKEVLYSWRKECAMYRLERKKENV